MKVALITDTHCGCRNDSSIFNDYFLKFYKEVFFPTIRKENISHVIHLGDVFDRRKYINFSILNSWRKEVFEELNKFNTTILLGNHDLYYRDTTAVNSLQELLFPYENIKIITNPTIQRFDNLSMLLVPWITSEEQSKVEEFIKTAKASVVLGHFDIVGFEMYRGLPNKEHGFQKEFFERFDLVFSGHYHHKSTARNISYLGTPYEMTWQDYGDDKGFHILDTTKLSVDFVKNPNVIFKKIVYDEQNIPVVDESISGCYLKVLVKNKTEQHKFDLFLQDVYSQMPADVTLIESDINIETEESDIDEAKDTVTLLVEYIDKLDFEDKIKTGLKEVMQQLYQQSQNIDV
jgi:DNA repair exonuclease SbcCD nuclease subunit